MNLGHSKRQKTAKRYQLRDRVLLERMQASVEACRVDVALCEKPYELASPTIWRAKKPVIFRLLSNLKSGLTVKIRNRKTRKILPLDLPSKRLGWVQ
jgi:hypothetical protein